MLRPIELALYVHIPFCAYRCRYCNFTFETGGSRATMEKTVDALVAEAEALVRQGEGDGLRWDVKTLYLGGGTPGLLPPELTVSLLARLEAVLDYRTSSLVEASLEANPENVCDESLDAWAGAGLNRLSLGVQTFSSERLALLGRWCDGDTNRRALGLVSDRWRGRFTADLMTGLPGQGALPPQRWTDVRRDLDELLSYQPGHLSVYSLIVEPGTVLARQVEGRSLRVASDPVTDQLWLRARQTLMDAGYEWYEISNFAKSGQRSRHNLAYWRMDPWAGLGPGAEGTLPARDNSGRLRPLRTRNPRLFPWLSGQNEREWLTAPEFAVEHYLSGWRTSEGLVTGRFASLFAPASLPAPERLSDSERLVLDTNLRAVNNFDGLEFAADWPIEG